MNDFERQLAEALAARTERMRIDSGSIRDVRLRAHRRTRRRAAVGAGALVAVGAVGAVVLASGSDDRARFAEAPSGDDGPATTFLDRGVWRCTGPVAPPDTSASDASTTTVFYDESLGVATTSLPASVNDDRVFYMSACSWIEFSAPGPTSVVPQTSTTTPGVLPSTTVASPPGPSTTVVPPPLASTTVVSPPLVSTTVPEGAAATSTTVVGSTPADGETTTTIETSSSAITTSTTIAADGGLDG